MSRLPCLVGRGTVGRPPWERMSECAPRQSEGRAGASLFRIRKGRPANLPHLQLRRGRSEVSSGFRDVR